MRLNSLRPLAVALALATSGTAAASEAYTTRIEPRPYYGATVTLEEGVRVFRPLPPHKHIVINPTNAPVSLSFNETTERNYHHYSGGNGGSAGGVAPAYGGYLTGWGPYAGKVGPRRGVGAVGRKGPVTGPRITKFRH